MILPSSIQNRPVCVELNQNVIMTCHWLWCVRVQTLKCEWSIHWQTLQSSFPASRLLLLIRSLMQYCSRCSLPTPASLSSWPVCILLYIAVVCSLFAILRPSGATSFTNYSEIWHNGGNCCPKFYFDRSTFGDFRAKNPPKSVNFHTTNTNSFVIYFDDISCVKLWSLLSSSALTPANHRPTNDVTFADTTEWHKFSSQHSLLS